MATTSKSKLTLSELDTADVHEVKAMLAGKDECRCKTCKRVRGAAK